MRLARLSLRARDSGACALFEGQREPQEKLGLGVTRRCCPVGGDEGGPWRPLPPSPPARPPDRQRRVAGGLSDAGSPKSHFLLISLVSDSLPSASMPDTSHRTGSRDSPGGTRKQTPVPEGYTGLKCQRGGGSKERGGWAGSLWAAGIHQGARRTWALPSGAAFHIHI